MKRAPRLLVGLAVSVLLTALLPVRGEEMPDPKPRTGELEGSAQPGDVFKEYLARQKEKDAVVAEAKKEFGKGFPEFTQEDYTRFMRNLDLARDDDLWNWSHVTGIHIAALRKRSNFFHYNAHLLKDVAAADKMTWKDLQKIKTKYNRGSGTLVLEGPEGKPLPLRKFPPGTVQHTQETKGPERVRYYAKDQIVFETLAPYLVPLKDLKNREEINEGIRALPLSMVKVLRGKAFYPTVLGKSGYAVIMPVSTDAYTFYVGMLPGGLAEPRKKRSSPDKLGVRSRGSLEGNSADSLIHEIGHLVDHTVLRGYGRFHHPYQFPAFLKLRPEKQRVFGKGDDKVPQTEHGYISRYARTNAQESFAEHFWAFILQKEAFLALAEKQMQKGHPELLEKFRFMEKLVEHTPTTMRRLGPG